MCNKCFLWCLRCTNTFGAECPKLKIDLLVSELFTYNAAEDLLRVAACGRCWPTRRTASAHKATTICICTYIYALKVRFRMDMPVCWECGWSRAQFAMGCRKLSFACEPSKIFRGQFASVLFQKSANSMIVVVLLVYVSYSLLRAMFQNWFARAHLVYIYIYLLTLRDFFWAHDAHKHIHIWNGMLEYIEPGRNKIEEFQIINQNFKPI